MKTVLALTTGVLLALAPAGTAFAGENVPVPGKAYGNCKHSSSGGNPHTALLPEVGSGKGNGGLVALGKSGVPCAAPTAVDEQPDAGTPPVVPVEPGAK